jgi:hypothetical protein
MGRPKVHGKKLDIFAVCDRLGISATTWQTYRYKGLAPEPDGKISTARGHFWYETTIERYEEARKAHRTNIDGGVWKLANQRAYELAGLMIASGAWRVLPEEGVIDAPNKSYVNGYVQIKLYHDDGKTYKVLAHRLIWEWRTGERQPLTGHQVVVHDNKIRDDNRIANLICKDRSDVRESYGQFGADERD